MDKKIKNLVSTLSILNINNHSKAWWAFNFTSKNPYNTFFFDRILFKKKYPSHTYNWIYIFIIFIKNIVKSFFLLSQAFIYYLSLKENTQLNKTILFSYIDGRSRKNGDTYFDNLIDLINSGSNINAGYLFYVYRPYFKNSKVIDSEKNDQHNIFSYLKPYDFIWCFLKIFKIPFTNVNCSNAVISNSKIDIKKIIIFQMISEISNGYLDNLIIQRAFRRLSIEKEIDRIIYPFENKSLEKLMLLEISDKIKTIGYQHSSITPSHFSLMLTNEERLTNPLPDVIVTIGEVTKNWLIENGKIPKEKIKTGVYLRGVKRLKQKKYFSSKNPSLLFVFSSSYDEIIRTIKFLKSGIQHLEIYKLTFRFHPDFPFNKLDKKYKDWINQNKILISKKDLQEELQFCDILIYLSSSIAIEALSYNIPIIKLDINPYDSDPLLNKKLELKRNAKNIIDLVNSIKEFSELKGLDNEKYFKDSIDYVNNYTIDKSNLNIKVFL